MSLTLSMSAMAPAAMAPAAARGRAMPRHIAHVRRVSVVGVTSSISTARLRRALLATRFAAKKTIRGAKNATATKMVPYQ